MLVDQDTKTGPIRMLWREPRIGLYLVGKSVSEFGDTASLLALNLWLYHLAHALWPLTVMWTIRAATRLVVQPLAGTIVDRVRLKQLFVVTGSISAVSSSAFAFIGEHTLWLAFPLIAALQTLSCFDVPATMAGLPRLVSGQQLVTLNSLLRVFINTAMVIGPSSGGLIYSVLGPRPLFLINGASYLVAVGAVLPLSFSPVRDDLTGLKKTTFLRDLRDGARYTLGNRIVLGVMLVAFIDSFVWRVVEIIFIPASASLFGLDSTGIGLVFTMLTLGGLAAGLLGIALRARISVPQAAFSIYLVSAAPLAVLTIGPRSGWVLATMFAAGLFIDLYGLAVVTVLQANAPSQMLGRISSLRGTALALGVLPAAVLAKPLVTSVGLAGTFAACAAVTAVTGTAAGLLTRRPSARADLSIPRPTVTKKTP